MICWDKIINIDVVHSTNDYFSEVLKEETYSEGSIITTSFQDSGKGQGNNTWESEKGKNLLCSIVLYPEFLVIDKNFLLSKAVSLGIVKYLKSKTSGIKIKWPNDIYYQDKKIAGILIENIIKGSSINQSIIGIGLNINQTHFLSNAPNPISLNQITGKVYSIENEIVKLRDCIRDSYEDLKSGKYKEINKLYIENLYRFNKFHSYKIENNIFKAKITGIHELGYLQILTEDQEKKEFEFKEIEFIINDQ